MATVSATGTRQNSPMIPQVPINYDWDDEPDDQWKAHQKQKIEDSFKPLIQEAKDQLERKIQNLQSMRVDLDPDWGEDHERMRLVEEFNSAKDMMRGLAKEQFVHALSMERLQRKLRRDIPPPVSHHHSLHLDLEQEQAATLKEASLNGGLDASAAFRSLIEPSSSSSPPPLDDFTSMTSDMDLPAEENEEEVVDDGPVQPTDGVAAINPWAGALAIKITPLPAEPAVNGNVWVKASDAARAYDLARRRARIKAEQPQIQAPPAEPPKKWVSASDAAKRVSSQRRIGSSH